MSEMCIISAQWLSEENSIRPQFKRSAIEGNGKILRPTGCVIDGWQRIEGIFTAKP